MTNPRREYSGSDRPVNVSEYVAGATAEYFGETGSIEAKEWTRAAAGLITLVVLGAIILFQVLNAAPGGSAH